MATEPRKVVYAALAGNALVAVTKFIAAAYSGSSSMLTEGVHSLVDTGNQGLLLLGMARAAKPADDDHPFGYGRELYFWSFMVALLIFALGAGVSIYEGIIHILAPEPIANVAVNYAVLGLAALFEGYSWLVSWRQFNRTRGDQSVWQAVRRSKNPTTIMVLFEDSAALFGILAAAVAISLSQWLEAPWIDGAGSIVIGLALATVAVLLARETKGLLIGERGEREVVSAVVSAARTTPGVQSVNGALSSQIGPDTIVVALSLEFADALRAPEIEAAVDGIERQVCSKHDRQIKLFVKPQTPAGWAGETRRHGERAK